MSGSETIEDITDYSRCHEMFQILSATDSRANDYAEGFCNYWDDKDTRSSNLNKSHLVGIPGGKYMTVLFKPLSGLLRQKNFIPLQYVPLKIELSLIGTAVDTIVNMVSGLNTPGTLDDVTRLNFYSDTTSLAWSIQNPQVKCDLLALDGTMQNAFDKT